MKRSLQRRLSLMLGGAILLSGMLAAVASFVLAYAEAKEFQDDMLRQIAMLEAPGIDSNRRGDAQDRSRMAAALKDPESLIRIVRRPADPLPDWLGGKLTPGFHTLASGKERLRLFVQGEIAGKATIVAQSTDTRDEIALNSALRTLLPLLLFLPLMLWLIVRILRHELRPISHLAGHLDAQPADRPRPLADDGLPDEIIPFVLAINRLLKRVGELMGQQRRFIADAAHELRSPLTALSIQAQNVQQASSLAAMHERVLPLQAGIERARTLTEQLLSLARTQSYVPAYTDVDVSAMARELIAEYLPRAEAKGIDLGLEEITPLKLNAASEPLQTILRNALENTLKYLAAGGEVTIRLSADADSDVIEVIDNGPGIPLSERERVFDPFYRLPGSRAEGSGLGLAITREAAASLGGRLSLLHRPDSRGLIFRYQQSRRS